MLLPLRLMLLPFVLFMVLADVIANCKTTNITKGNNISLSGNSICHNYIYGKNISQIQKAITSALWAITSATIIYMAITSAKYNIFSYQTM